MWAWTYEQHIWDRYRSSAKWTQRPLMQLIKVHHSVMPPKSGNPARRTRLLRVVYTVRQTNDTNYIAYSDVQYGVKEKKEN